MKTLKNSCGLQFTVLDCLFRLFNIAWKQTRMFFDHHLILSNIYTGNWCFYDKTIIVNINIKRNI